MPSSSTSSPAERSSSSLQQRPHQGAGVLAGPVPRAGPPADELAGAVHEHEARSYRRTKSDGSGAVRVEQHLEGDRMLLEPRRDAVRALADADGPDDQSALLELPMKRLDLRGQLPRADRSPGGPEIEEDHLPSELAERMVSAVDSRKRQGRGIAPPGSDRESAQQRFEAFRRDGVHRGGDEQERQHGERRDRRAAPCTAPWMDARSISRRRIPFHEISPAVNFTVDTLQSSVRIPVTRCIAPFGRREAVSTERTANDVPASSRLPLPGRDAVDAHPATSPEARRGPGQLRPRRGESKGGMLFFPRLSRSDP